MNSNNRLSATLYSLGI